MRESPPGLLSEPVVTFDREGDHVVSAYLELRAGVKAAGCVQPRPDVLVFFYVAADGIPIGIRFHEPASGVAVCELLDTLVEGAIGPEGVDCEARYHFFTKPRELQAFVKALREAIIGLEACSSSSPGLPLTARATTTVLTAPGSAPRGRGRGGRFEGVRGEKVAIPAPLQILSSAIASARISSNTSSGMAGPDFGIV